jgi:hypothetical protein
VLLRRSLQTCEVSYVVFLNIIFDSDGGRPLIMAGEWSLGAFCVLACVPIPVAS